MKKIIIKYGLITGGIVSAMLCISIPLHQSGVLSYNISMIYGFASMIIALTMLFFGVRKYRDDYQNGKITFAKGFLIGILITLVASLLYAVTWEVYYSVKGDEFNKWYASCQTDKLIAEGVSGVKLEEAKEKINHEMAMYTNFFVRFGFTLMEIFPVGLIVSVITAGILRKR